MQLSDDLSIGEINSKFDATVNGATGLLGSVFEVHLHECSSPDLSVAVLGASTPPLTEALLKQCHKHKVSNVHLVEPDAVLIDRANRSSEIGVKVTKTRSLPADLRANPAKLDDKLRSLTCHDVADWEVMRRVIADQAQSTPLMDNESVNIVVMDMILNRLTPIEGECAINEAFRVLRRNGRLLITVLLADEQLQTSLPLTVGDCRAIHFPTEQEIMAKLEQAGYYGMSYVDTAMPTSICHGHAELGVFVIEAFKGKQGVCQEQGHAVILRGPWSGVFDDDGHGYRRGERTAVCAKTYALLMQYPYKDFFIGLTCRTAPPLESAPLFDCATPKLRHPRVTKGLVGLGNDGQESQSGESCCAPNSGCC